MTSLHSYLYLAAILFCVGLAGALTRRNSILILAGIELMLNAANINFVAFWRFHPDGAAGSAGLMFVLFSIAIAAAEAGVGLALIIAVYRHFRSSNLSEAKELRE